MKNRQAIIIIYICMRVIDIFLGPFLVAYFVKISTQTIVDLSIFHIMNYMFLCIFGIFVGYFVEKGHSLGTFRLGVLARFFYILMIMILGSKITNYFSWIAFLYGFSSMFYHLPFNLYHTDCVENFQRNDFEFKMNVAKNFINIFIPILLGTIITITNYQLTALIILVFSIIQIIASFYLKPLPKSDYQYHLFRTFKSFLKDKQVRKMFLVDYLNGMTFSDGVLGTVVTVLIMFLFHSDFHLGILQSATAILSLIVIYLYSKCFKGKDDKKIIYVSGVLLFLFMLFLAVSPSEVSIFLYQIIFGVFGVGLLTFIYSLRLFNLAKITVRDSEKTEYWVFRELFLNVGRITGYVLLLIVGLLGLEYLTYILIFLSFVVLVFTFYIAKIYKHDV